MFAGVVEVWIKCRIGMTVVSIRINGVKDR